jgi:hypothetical protein
LASTTVIVVWPLYSSWFGPAPAIVTSWPLVKLCAAETAVTVLPTLVSEGDRFRLPRCQAAHPVMLLFALLKLCDPLLRLVPGVQSGTPPLMQVYSLRVVTSVAWHGAQMLRRSALFHEPAVRMSEVVAVSGGCATVSG